MCLHLSRTPHGVRGLKSHYWQTLSMRGKSHPSRGAWIEIKPLAQADGSDAGRTPHGVRGLKYARIASSLQALGRTPHGVRGLKSNRPRISFGCYGRTPHGVRGLK